MIDAFVQVLSSSAVGSAIGGVFGWLNKKEERKERESERKFQLEMVAAKVNAEQLSAEARAFEKSQETKSGIADIIKSMVRPVITAAVMFQVYLIYTGLETITGGLESLPNDLTLQLYREIVLNVISLASTVVAWWFAARPSYSRKK